MTRFFLFLLAVGGCHGYKADVRIGGNVGLSDAGQLGEVGGSVDVTVSPASVDGGQ